MLTTKTAKNGLEAIAAYYLHPDQLPSGESEALRQLFLTIVSLSGAGLYAVPSYNYAKRVYGEDSPLTPHFIFGTCVPALIVLYNATEVFLIERAKERTPDELTPFLEHSLTRIQKILRDAGIIFISALSATPIAMNSLTYSIPGASFLLSLIECGVVEFDNTILHFLPIHLALQQAGYRFPIVPFEYAYGYYRQRSLSQSEKQQQTIERQ